MDDREKLIELICEACRKAEICNSIIADECRTSYGDCGFCTITADHLIANGVVIQKQGKMDSLEAVDKFRDELMNKFVKLCNYNDFGKLRLEKIADTVNDVYDKCIDDLLQTAHQR